MDYKRNINSELLDLVIKLTGIPEKTIEPIVLEHGINFIFEHPKVLEVSQEQMEKLLALKQFINSYNEALFLKEDVDMNNSNVVKEYFARRLKNELSREYFEVAFLNKQLKLIATKRLFAGTIDESPVYPRIVVETAIKYDAQAVVFAHNHPAATAAPSASDIAVTRKLIDALNGVSIRVLDHVIIAGNSATSFAERGLITLAG